MLMFNLDYMELTDGEDNPVGTLEFIHDRGAVEEIKISPYRIPLYFVAPREPHTLQVGVEWYLRPSTLTVQRRKDESWRQFLKRAQRECNRSPWGMEPVVEADYCGELGAVQIGSQIRLTGKLKDLTVLIDDLVSEALHQALKNQEEEALEEAETHPSVYNYGMASIQVHSRKSLPKLQDSDNAGIISIGNPDTEYPHSWLHETKLPVLWLRFYDLAEDNFGDYPVFTDEIAQAIFDWIKEVEPRHLYIHCDLGQSRSVAVGKFLHDLLGVPIVYGDYGDQDYNREIYRKLSERFIKNGCRL